MSAAARQVMAAREDMLSACPFWGALALRLTIVEDASCDTAWTDGESIGYSPDYIASISHNERVFLLAHEVAHCAFGHPWRRDGRDHLDFNRATDYAINSELQRHGFTLPNGVLIDARYDGRSAEWIYDRLAQSAPVPPPEPGPGQDEGDEGDDAQGDENGEDEGDENEGDGSPDNAAPGGAKSDEGEDEEGEGAAQPGAPQEAPGEVRDAPSPQGDEAPGMDEGDWRQAVAEAALTAKARGEYGANVERIVQQTQTSKVDWPSVLRRFVSEAAQADYSWRAPNTRFLASGMYLPAIQADGLGHMVVAIDTSGSVDETQLAQMESEVRAIVGEAQPSRTTVLYCDTRINGVDHFDQGEPVTLTLRGGGGTDFRPVFNWVEVEGERPACLVYLTDLMGTFPRLAPDYPVLWVDTSIWDQSAPWGEVVRAGSQ